MGEHEVIDWVEDDEDRSARWRSESGAPPPKQMAIADDRMTADAAYRLACEGTALLWRGDFQNARQRSAVPSQARRQAASAVMRSSASTTWRGGGAPLSECQRAECGPSSSVQPSRETALTAWPRDHRI